MKLDIFIKVLCASTCCYCYFVLSMSFTDYGCLRTQVWNKFILLSFGSNILKIMEIILFILILVFKLYYNR